MDVSPDMLAEFLQLSPVLFGAWWISNAFRSFRVELKDDLRAILGGEDR